MKRNQAELEMSVYFGECKEILERNLTSQFKIVLGLC